MGFQRRAGTSQQYEKRSGIHISLQRGNGEEYGPSYLFGRWRDI